MMEARHCGVRRWCGGRRQSGASRCGNGAGNSPVGRHHTKMHPCLLAGASVTEDRQVSGAVEWPRRANAAMQADGTVEAEWGRRAARWKRSMEGKQRGEGGAQ
jgi:hypothetical protein